MADLVILTIGGCLIKCQLMQGRVSDRGSMSLVFCRGHIRLPKNISDNVCDQYFLEKLAFKEKCLGWAVVNDRVHCQLVICRGHIRLLKNIFCKFL